MKIIEMLETHDFFEYRLINGKKYPYRGKKTIKHPLPTEDEGELYINSVSPIKCLDNNQLVSLVLRVNNRAIDRYFQSIRKRLSILDKNR
ncbi:hypothetical protein [Clostridium gasigenes]|uniref:hypothetical protein n=1 Tax=Clostridium gasigenes TaxID=94869 RepID=UPI001C0D25AD|nr:hypothetical protein [Clostridium gasigenes]MBU3107724.1 hypothetical protein [Clostridium gasigenes]